MKHNLFNTVAIGACFSTAVMADTATDTMIVQATLVATCVVNTGTFRDAPSPALLNFGVVIAGRTTRADTAAAAAGSGAASVICSTGVPWTLTASGGDHLSGTQRQMSDGTMTLPYSLYRDGGHAFPIGIDDPANPVASGTGTSAVQMTPIYGVITSDTPIPSVGNYSDNVTLTINY